MEFIRSSPSYLPRSKKVVLTLGNFDGVHLGHQAILSKMKETEGYTVVLTFSNHPSEVLSGQRVKQLTSLEHRIKLIEDYSIHSICTIPFTRQLSEQSAEFFLHELKSTFNFTHLILGHDAVFGHNQEGNRVRVYALSQKMGFTVEYVNPIMVKQTIVSSSVIRKSIESGDLSLASEFLGRSYSLRAIVERGTGKGQVLGFRTANLPVDGLCLPPFGVYAIKAKIENQSFHGVANLGIAPTLRQNSQVLFEAHLFDCEKNFYGEELEIYPEYFLRPEKKFSSIEELKKQIINDSAMAKQIFLQPLVMQK
jgi:riboflavin kinase/FMN adenylyltransferase